MDKSEFKAVFSSTKWSNDFYRFLQVIFHLYPEDKFHQLLLKIANASEFSTDEAIYKEVQSNLSSIKPFLSELTYALPALKKQKKEMANQVLKLLGTDTKINGYLEIGSTGRYISELKNHIRLAGKIYLTNDISPNNSIGDIFERGQISKLGTFFPLDNYIPINNSLIPDSSLDVVTCHIGLHHCTPDKLPGYLQSIHRVLRNGGKFIIRDHDVKDPEMATFVSVVHSVFNLGLNVSWETDKMEYKSFKSIENWSKIITEYGFTDTGARLLQDNDPSDNTLCSFIKL